jgi:hypothetical protein
MGLSDENAHGSIEVALLITGALSLPDIENSAPTIQTAI